ncbi:MAG: hypothetical protein EAZ62_03390, partial [Sphingobacteriia bacterium]
MRFFLFLLLSTCVWACQDKAIDYSGNTPLPAKTFAAVFPLVQNNWTMADTAWVSLPDSPVLGYPLLKQYFPDTAFQGWRLSTTKFFPVGRIEKEKETYFLLAAKEGKKQGLLVLVCNEKMQFLGAKSLMDNQHKDEYRRMVSINKEPTFLLSQEKKGPREETLFTRTGWVFNNAGFFMVVIKDSNEDPTKTKVINPLDTLPRKQKLSGDFGKKPDQLLSIRDGKDPQHYQFFLSINKAGSSC